MPEDSKPTRYIGDGVYAIYDGFGMWLHANHHEFPTDKVYLEPEVMAALDAFWKYCIHKKKEEVKKNEEREILRDEADPNR